MSNQNLALSIQAGLNGLSFLILDNFSNQVVDLFAKKYEKKLTSNEVLDKLNLAFESHKSLQRTFEKVQIIHDNEMYTLVPSALFEEAHLSDYLKYNTKIYKTDFITYDVIQNQDMMLVYVPFVNINNNIFERFGSFEYKHCSTVIIDKILQLEKNNEGVKVYINVETFYFEMVVLKDNVLQLFNRFEYVSKEDFIYYILFTAEQLELNPEQFKCILMGNIKKEDDLYLIAYKYIRYIDLLPAKKMRYTTDSSTNHFALLNSF